MGLNEISLTENLEHCAIYRGKFNACIAKSLKATKFTQRYTVQEGGTWYMTRLPVNLVEAVCCPPFRTGNSELQVCEEKLKGRTWLDTAYPGSIDQHST